MTTQKSISNLPPSPSPIKAASDVVAAKKNCLRCVCSLFYVDDLVYNQLNIGSSKINVVVSIPVDSTVNQLKSTVEKELNEHPSCSNNVYNLLEVGYLERDLGYVTLSNKQALQDVLPIDSTSYEKPTAKIVVIVENNDDNNNNNNNNNNNVDSTYVNEVETTPKQAKVAPMTTSIPADKDNSNHINNDNNKKKKKKKRKSTDLKILYNGILETVPGPEICNFFVTNTDFREDQVKSWKMSKYQLYDKLSDAQRSQFWKERKQNYKEKEKERNKKEKERNKKEKRDKQKQREEEEDEEEAELDKKEKRIRKMSKMLDEMKEAEEMQNNKIKNGKGKKQVESESSSSLVHD